MAIDYQCKNQSFYAQEFSDCILIAFVSGSPDKKSYAKIADSIYKYTYAATSYLDEKDAADIYEHVKSKGLNYSPDSLIVLNTKRTIQSIYGQDIFPEYVDEGNTLRLYYKDRNHLAISIKLPNHSYSKIILCTLLALCVIGLSVYIITSCIYSSDRKKEQQQEEVLTMRDSLNEIKSKYDDLNAEHEQIIHDLDNKNDSLNAIQVQLNEANERKKVDDSIRNLQLEQERTLQNQQTSNRSHVSSNRQSKPSKKQPKQNLRENNEDFSRLIDRGNNFASSYYLNGKESDRRHAIEAYEKALRLHPDSKISEKINKLKRVQK